MYSTGTSTAINTHLHNCYHFVTHWVIILQSFMIILHWIYISKPYDIFLFTFHFDNLHISPLYKSFSSSLFHFQVKPVENEMKRKISEHFEVSD